NTALKQAGVELYTVRPQAKKSANDLTITATGVHVVFIQPVNQSGVPSQTAEHIVGEVFADSLAAPPSPVPTLNLAGTGSVLGGIGTSGSSGAFGGGTSSTGYYSSSGTGAGATGGTQASPSTFTTLLSKPAWLLAAYLVWQAL